MRLGAVFPSKQINPNSQSLNICSTLSHTPSEAFTLPLLQFLYDPHSAPRFPALFFGSPPSTPPRSLPPSHSRFPHGVAASGARSGAAASRSARRSPWRSSRRSPSPNARRAAPWSGGTRVTRVLRSGDPRRGTRDPPRCLPFFWGGGEIAGGIFRLFRLHRLRVRFLVGWK